MKLHSATSSGCAECAAACASITASLGRATRDPKVAAAAPATPIIVACCMNSRRLTLPAA
jgi:hypothetical protein